MAPRSSLMHEIQQKRAGEIWAIRGDYHLELDARAQTKMLADRQIVHMLLRSQKERPQSARRRPRTAAEQRAASLSAGHSPQIHDARAYDSMVSLCNSYESQLLELKLEHSKVVEQLEDFEARANERYDEYEYHLAASERRNGELTRINKEQEQHLAKREKLISFLREKLDRLSQADGGAADGVKQ